MRYHRCCAPRYRVYKANLHNFRLTQLLYGSVTLARCAALPCRFSLPPTTSRGFLSHSPMATYNTLWQCTGLTIGLRRTWCNGRTRQLNITTFRWPYLLPHCGFPFSASQFGKSYVRKKVMQWICRRFASPSSTALLTRYPGRIGSHTTKKDTPSGVPLT